MKKIAYPLIFTTFLLGLFTFDAQALDPVYTGRFSSSAIKGYDTVAYHTQAEPVKGTDKFETRWKDTTWRFSSKQNLTLFKENPEKYAPAYGGYCSWAVSEGYTAGIDPDAWKIVDGQLYLNYNKKIQSRWQKDIPGNVQKADKNWPTLLNEE